MRVTTEAVALFLADLSGRTLSGQMEVTGQLFREHEATSTRLAAIVQAFEAWSIAPKGLELANPDFLRLVDLIAGVEPRPGAPTHAWLAEMAKREETAPFPGSSGGIGQTRRLQLAAWEALMVWVLASPGQIIPFGASPPTLRAEWGPEPEAGITGTGRTWGEAAGHLWRMLEARQAAGLV